MPTPTVFPASARAPHDGCALLAPYRAGLNESGAVDRANRLLERVSTLSLTEWLRIGQGIARDRAGLATRLLASAELEAAIAGSDLHFVAWRVRDDIDTLFFLASHSTLYLTRTDRALLAMTKRAARDAALAELVRDTLSVENREILFASFAD